MIKIAWAKIRCNFYLLFAGMWRGETQLVGYGHSGKVLFIAAFGGGTLLTSDWHDHVSKVFFVRSTPGS